MSRQSSKWRPNISLAQLLLLVAAIAVAMAYVRVHRELEQTRAAVRSMRALTRELTVDDPTKIAAITRMPTLPDEHIIDIHLPAESDPTQKRFLRLALEGIVAEGDRAAQFPSPVDEHPISAGLHTVELRHHRVDNADPQSQHVVEVLLDKKVVFNRQLPQSWMPANGWTSAGKITETLTFNPDEPAELHRRRFDDPTPTGSRSVPVDKPANGILIWIE